MKFCIYQINLDRDTDRVAFEGLENLQRFHDGTIIRSDLYDKIYEGDIPCSGLEELFHIFNVEHPADYPGRSMSVSDVVEVIDAPKLVGVIETEFRVERFTDFLEYISAQEALRDQDTEFVAHDYMGLNVPAIEPGFYFCDSVGFKQIIFHPENAGPKEKVAAPQNAKALLKSRIEENYSEFKSKWLQMSPEELIRNCEEVEAVTRMYRDAPDALSEEAAEYLLRFKNPLMVLGDEWVSCNGIDSFIIDDDLGHIMWELMDRREAEDYYELEPEYTATKEDRMQEMSF